MKEFRPNVEIVLYGSDQPLPADYGFENRGFINDIKVLNKIYNECSIGLCLSMTNPSRIPFEFMASGVIPIDLYRYNNLFDYENGTALLAFPNKNSISQAILSLLADTKEQENRRFKCLEFSSTHTLEWEMDVIANAIISEINGCKIKVPIPKVAYTDKPVIAEIDLSRRVLSYCDWHRNFSRLPFLEKDIEG